MIEKRYKMQFRDVLTRKGQRKLTSFTWTWVMGAEKRLKMNQPKLDEKLFK